MEGPRRQFLTRTAFPLNEDTGRGISHPGQLLVEIHHGGRRADKLRCLGRSGLTPHPALLQLADFQDLFHHGPDLIG